MAIYGDRDKDSCLIFRTEFLVSERDSTCEYSMFPKGSSAQSDFFDRLDPRFIDIIISDEVFQVILKGGDPLRVVFIGGKRLDTMSLCWAEKGLQWYVVGKQPTDEQAC